MGINSKTGNELELKIARAVQEACIQEAKNAYEEAAISGLCDEGALEAAIGAIQTLDIDALLADIHNP